MSKISLSSYTITLREDGLVEPINLHSMDESNMFEKIINNFFDYHKERFTNDEANEKVFKTTIIDKIDNKDSEKEYYYTYAKVESGEYGVSSDIIDPITSGVVYTIKSGEAPVLPFSVLVIRPRIPTTRAFIIVQNISNYGIKTVLEKYLKQYFSKYHSQYKIHIAPLAPKEYVKTLFEKYDINKIRFISYNVPEDDRNKMSINNGITCRYEEKVFHGVSLKETARLRLLSLKNYGKRVSDFGEIQGFDKDYDDIKIEFNVGKSKKTIALKNIDNLMFTDDISEKVELVNGHPTPDSLLLAMIETAEYLLRDWEQIK